MALYRWKGQGRIGIRKKIDLCEGQIEKETDLKERIQIFKNTLSANQEIEQFDREVFESIVEKVIVGGYDDEGNKDPYRITFIYKTGFKNGVNNSKMKYGKRMNGKDGSNLCTNEANEMMDLCSNDSIDACGDGSTFEQQICQGKGFCSDRNRCGRLLQNKGCKEQ